MPFYNSNHLAISVFIIPFFIAVEKVTLLCQFLSVDIIRDSSLAKSTLVHGFVYLISAIDDVHSAVAARARTMVTSINKKSLKVTIYFLI